MSNIELVSNTDVKLIHHNISDEMIAMAAWVSHDQDNEERLAETDRLEKLIDFLLRNKHMSPFEHNSLTVKVDVPLFVRSEWHRHRTQAFNEVSGRYTTMQPRFWAGESVRVQQGKPGDYYFVPGTNEQYAVYIQGKRRMAETAWDTYQERLAAGIAKEQAREDLPLSLMTQFYATSNLRNWLHFLELRLDKHALEEIRVTAQKVEAIIAEAAPLAYESFKRHGL